MWKGGARKTKAWPGSTSSLQGPPSEAMTPSMSMEPMEIDGGPLPSLESGSIGLMSLRSDTGVVFTSHEFEDKLVQFAVSEVASSGRMPPDEAIQARAKELSGFEVWQTAPTPADDPVLLGKFKKLVVDKVRAVLGGQEAGSTALRPHAATFPAMDHTPERGQDAIDPSLLPALESSTEVTRSEMSPTVHVAVSEQRLEEIIDEALQR